ncbi:DUF2194 domain-containing protein [Salimicrobium album]|uniref:Polysaccharide deacetylase n=1 Tax=Salimicrobium album TaxID=50717 RepID=A0A1H3BD19_9BACI|nr:DUF2194 domain-containing protein [Salimicrobium album]SDX39920.1 hypothetical protein SAMN04488081_0398 [Salimicrobium album]
MKKHTIQLSITFAVLLIGMVTILQLIRMETFQQWFPPNSSPENEFPVMTAEEPKKGEEELKVFLHQNESDLSEGAIGNMKQALEYAKVPYEQVGREEIKNIAPSPYSIIVLAGEHSEEWPRDVITEFVEEGGRVMIAGRFVDSDWNDFLGIKKAEGYKGDLHGISFEQELFPGYVDLGASSELFSHSIADVELKEEVAVPLTVEEKPLMWIHERGKGKVMFWNSTITVDKTTRGMLLQSLSMLPPAFVSAQASIKVFHIDDFPSPIPFETPEKIEQEYDKSIRDFYTDVWWEDMKEIGENHDFTYTGYLIGTYRDDTELKGKEIRENLRYPMLYFGRDLLSEGGELGLHGYNHQSLVTPSEPIDETLGYVPWKNNRQMVEMIKEVEGVFKYYFPDEEIKSYVPPSNVINTTGIKALEQSLPELKTISSLYIGGDKGSLEQEFGPGDVKNNLYYFPRMTSGYAESPEDQFLQTDVIANFGVFSHFVHPDDVLDSYRAQGRNWSQMRSRLQDMGEHVKENYPYLEAMTQSNATKKMKSYQESELTVSYKEDRIVITGDEILKPSEFLIRLENGKFLNEGKYSYGSVDELSEGLYRVTVKEPEAEILIKERGK